MEAAAGAAWLTEVGRNPIKCRADMHVLLTLYLALPLSST